MAVTYTSINLTGSSFASWRNLTANTQDDNRSDFTDIGFDFWYDGTRYTQFSVSTNGFLDFSTSTDDGGPQADNFGYQNTAFTAANAANATRPAIAPFYDDLTAQGGVAALGNSIKYFLSGSAPNRTLTIEWINMAVYNNVSPSLNFQVKLVETSGVIIIHYGTMTSGSNTFSYSMGLNGPTVSNTPTAAQLKELQTVNVNTFGFTVQNGLATMPAAASQYIFTPIAPTAVSGALSFTGVNQTAMTLNWTNWASNEIGYVVYNSTDGVNYDFVVQTAANAVSSTVTGLLPATTYFWKVYAVTEGALSSALNGSQATTAAGNKISVASGNWNSAVTWSPTGIPSAADNVTVTSTHVVTITAASACNNLVVGLGAASTLEFGGNTNLTLSVNNNITVNALAKITTLANSAATHTIVVEGNVVNNGIINFAVDADSKVDVLFDKDGNQTLSGSGATNSFNRINLNLGSSSTNTLEITASNFSAPANFLDMVAGTLKISTTNAVNITPFSNAVTITANTGLFLNSSSLIVSTGAGVTLYGAVNIANGTLNVGNAADEDIVSNGGTINISGGALNIAGKLDGSGINNVCDFNISGGTVTLPTVGSTNTLIAPFHISSAGSECNMTGGLIVIQRPGGTTQNLGFTNTGTSGAIVTGGTLQIGNASTPAASTIDINTDTQIQNLLVNSANATARINTNSLIVVDKVTITTGILNANNLNLAVGGNWSNSGTFTPGTGLVNFNGTLTQSILKTGGETFYAVQFSNGGLKTLAAALTANNNFSISTGASVDVSASNFAMILKGNFINSGTLNARSGLVTFSGTAAQTIGGSSTTTFYDLTLNNSTGATLSNAENLKGTLTLTSGILTTTSQIFTLLSDATNTARIAAITGGNLTGNITIQRFAPGGSTGWAFLGSPISSALTLADWDDDIAISCATCPDGSAAGFLSIYTYNEAATGIYDAPASYVPLNNINDPIIAGKGYWVYLGTGLTTSADITLDLTGTPRKFAYTIPLVYTNTGSPANDGWNLISNPYPSAISWASLKAATANIDNAIYVYNADLNSGTGGFAAYVNGISSPVVGSGGVSDVIAMGQGFYVHSTGATGLNAVETNKVASNPNFLKSSSASQSLMRLTLLGANAYEDETVLYLEPGAHSYFDEGFDSYKMRGQDPNAASIALEDGSDVFQINGVAPITGNYTSPLKTLTGLSGTFTITAKNIGSFPSGACISLYDKFTSLTTDLKTSDYTFNLSDTTTVSRFILSITINPLTVSSAVKQPECTQPAKGDIVAVGNSAGPWNYYWTSNGVAVRTKLNKATADTLSSLSNGNFNLMINTVGMCDNKETSFSIHPQVPSTASFMSIDTLYLDGTSSVQFLNNSVNAASNNWDFGTGLDYSTNYSPVFSYSSPGDYKISLIVSSSTGCQDTAFRSLTVLSELVGIIKQGLTAKELLIKSLDNNVYSLQASFDKEMPVHSTITDAGGRLIMDYGTRSSKDLNLEINLNDQAKGIYFLSLVSESDKKVIKLPVK